MYRSCSTTCRPPLNTSEQASCDRWRYPQRHGPIRCRTRIDLRIKLIDHLRRRVSGCANAEPRATLVQRSAGALIVGVAPYLEYSFNKILAEATLHKIPAIYPHRGPTR